MIAKTGQVVVSLIFLESVGIFVDFERKMLHFYVNGIYYGTPDFRNQTEHMFEDELVPGLNCYTHGDSMTLLVIGQPSYKPKNIKLIPFQ